MNIKKVMWTAICIFIFIVALAVAFSARFSISNITSDIYTFIENFFSQWSPALGAAGTIILAISIFSFISENRRREKREYNQAIYSLHDEILWNLNNIITLRFQISEHLKYMRHNTTPSNPTPFELLETSVFDDIRNRGQLHLLEELRMDIIFCYKLIRDYNIDKCFKPNHTQLLATLNERLDKVIRDIEGKFRFLPTYIKETGGKTEDKDSKGQQNQEEDESKTQAQRSDFLIQFIHKYAFKTVAVVALLPIIILLFLAISFAIHSTINYLLVLGFVCDSLAAGIALYVSFLNVSRKWYIPAIEFFVLGMFFKLFGML